MFQSLKIYEGSDFFFNFGERKFNHIANHKGKNNNFCFFFTNGTLNKMG